MKKLKEKILFYGELFLPMFIMILGGMITVWAGVQDACPTCAGYFDSLLYMEGWGWTGAALVLFGAISAYWRPWR